MSIQLFNGKIISSQELPTDLKVIDTSGDLYVGVGNEPPMSTISFREMNAGYSGLEDHLVPLVVISYADFGKVRAKLQKYDENARVIAKIAGFNATTIKPLYIYAKMNGHNNSFAVDWFKTRKLNSRKFTEIPSNISLQANQWTQNQTSALQYWNSVIGSEDLMPDYSEQSKVWNEKDHYLALVENFDRKDIIPSHVQTVTLRSDRLSEISSFEDLQNLFENKSDRFYIKSSRDAGGEVAVEINSSNFDAKIKLLQLEIQSKGRNEPIDLLIQEMITPPENGNLPNRIGVNGFINEHGEVEITHVCGQIYSDPGCKEYLGSDWEKRLENQIIDKIGREKLLELFKLFSAKGYRGPFGIDFMLHKQDNNETEYVGIYDFNPRFSATFNAMSVKSWLENQAAEVESIINMGYRGRLEINNANLSKLIAELEENNLLFTKSNQKGLFLMPNLHNLGFDPIFINIDTEEINDVLKSVQKYASNFDLPLNEFGEPVIYK
jgi:hypothetical protein